MYIWMPLVGNKLSETRLGIPELSYLGLSALILVSLLSNEIKRTML